MEDEDRWLLKAVKAFEGCKEELESSGGIDLEAYVRALELIPLVFDSLGSVFGFAKKDIQDKAKHILASCSGKGKTIKEAVGEDFKAGRALAGRDPEAVSRPLHRITNSLKFLNLLLKDTLREGNEEHLRVSAQKAFKESIEYYLEWVVKKAVAAGMYLLPSREAFLKKIGETEESARGPAIRLVEVTEPILSHVYGIYEDLGIEL